MLGLHAKARSDFSSANKGLDRCQYRLSAEAFMTSCEALKVTGSGQLSDIGRIRTKPLLRLQTRAPSPGRFISKPNGIDTPHDLKKRVALYR
jgi:hypothetical protein